MRRAIACLNKMIEYLFFFLAWNTETKQEQIVGVKLDFNLPKEEGKKFNIIYNLERTYLFWIIPLSSWKIDSIEIQSLKSGMVYELEEEFQEQAEELYWELKEEEK